MAIECSFATQDTLLKSTETKHKGCILGYIYHTTASSRELKERISKLVFFLTGESVYVCMPRDDASMKRYRQDLDKISSHKPTAVSMCVRAPRCFQQQTFPKLTASLRVSVPSLFFLTKSAQGTQPRRSVCAVCLVMRVER